jgi:hypothetical protein
MIPGNLSIMVAVIAMVIATLLAASLVSTYQRHQHYRRRHVQALLQGAQRNERLLTQLPGVSLPRDVRVLLRRDIQDRYRAVARLYAGYPGIGDLLRQAEQRLGAEGGDSSRQLPIAPDDAVFSQWQAGMQELLAVIPQGGILRPLPPGTCQEYLSQLRERLAECLFGHYMNQANKLKQEGRHMIARNRIQHLQELLRGLGSHSERVRELLAEAESAYRYLLDGTTPPMGEQAASG